MTIVPAVATICFDGFGDEDFVPAFRHAPELGVLDIEFNAWYARNLTVEGLDRIVARCEPIGARVAALQVSPFAAISGSADVAREVSRWMWLLEAASRLDTSMVKATGPARGTPGGLEGIIEVLRTVAPSAERHGMTIAVENHYANAVEHLDDYARIFDAVPSTAVGVCLDTGHFAASGVDAVEVIDTFGDRVVHVDLKDCAAVGAADFVRFGHGVVDFDRVLAAARDRGYSGYALIELPLIDRDTMLDDLTAGLHIAQLHSFRE